MYKKIVFSGIQPTGCITIGNYLGVIKQWKKIQLKYQCLFCIADLHALTGNNLINLEKNTQYTLALFISSGLNPNKNIIFRQSDVIQHLELAWILSCNTSFKCLNNMIQFKENIKKKKKK